MDVVGKVWGVLLRNAETGQWRAKITFDPPVRAPVWGEVRMNYEEAERDLELLAMQWQAAFESTGHPTELVHLTACPRGQNN